MLRTTKLVKLSYLKHTALLFESQGDRRNLQVLEF